MRDVERIGSFLAEFEELWKEHPDLRFGQLVLICYRLQPTGQDAARHIPLWGLEDEDFMIGMDHTRKRLHKK